MKKNILLVIAFLTMMISCSSSEDTIKMVVASDLVDCMGIGPQKCMQVKEGNTTEWSFFYDQIEGFTHEVGYEYVLDVKKDTIDNVPADASSIKYTLVKKVSKTKKKSDNMLPGIPIPTKYTWGGKVLSMEDINVGVGAAKGQFVVKRIKLQVTTVNPTVDFKEGDTIHCELLPETKVTPVVGREYVFKANKSHPAHALGVYMLDTDVLDLIN